MMTTTTTSKQLHLNIYNRDESTGGISFFLFSGSLATVLIIF